MLDIKHEIKVVGESIFVKMWNNIESPEAQNYVSIALKKEDFLKAGTLLDRQSLPVRICALIFNEFYKKAALKIVEASQLVDNESLRNSMIDYARSVENADVQLVSEDVFSAMMVELQTINDSL